MQRAAWRGTAALGRTPLEDVVVERLRCDERNGILRTARTHESQCLLVLPGKRERGRAGVPTCATDLQQSSIVFLQTLDCLQRHAGRFPSPIFAKLSRFTASDDTKIIGRIVASAGRPKWQPCTAQSATGCCHRNSALSASLLPGGPRGEKGTCFFPPNSSSALPRRNKRARPRQKYTAEMTGEDADGAGHASGAALPAGVSTECPPPWGPSTSDRPLSWVDDDDESSDDEPVVEGDELARFCSRRFTSWFGILTSAINHNCTALLFHNLRPCRLPPSRRSTSTLNSRRNSE